MKTIKNFLKQKSKPKNKLDAFGSMNWESWVGFSKIIRKIKDENNSKRISEI